MQTGDSTYYYVMNLQGDVVALLDASGNAVASYAYDPYGKVLSAEGTMAETNPLRYRGYYYDTESGLYYLQSRYYDPATCRFINADGYASTGQGVWGCNMFAYCNNDPVNLNDSKGNVPLRNTMTQMTDGGPRDRRYYIESLAKKYSLDTEDTRPRITGVRYTAATPSGKINSQEYALGIAKVERGKIATTSAFPDASKICLAFATVDFAGADSSINVPIGKGFSNNIYLDGVGISFTGPKSGNNQMLSSLKLNVLEETLELKMATIQYENGFTNTTYVTYSVKLWAVALGVIAIADGMSIAVIAFA